MKKLISVFVLCLLLCSCGMETIPESSTTEPEIYIDVDYTVHYSNMSEFLASDFCRTMQEEGYTVYVPSWDEEKFSLFKVESDRGFYTFIFKEEATSEMVRYQICYNTYQKTVDELAANALDTTGDSYATVEKDGVTYEIYIPKTPYMSEPRYNLYYIPFDEYTVYISTGSPTPEAALAYIHEFDLVPAVAQESTSEEIPAETSAE